MSELVSFRKQLHAAPELSGEEAETAKKIVDELKKYSPSEIIEKLGGHGIAVIFNGQTAGKTTLFRAELDALPIQETNAFPHASITKGVSHKCGHDGHATILVGLAKTISEKPLKKGKVVLLFQPAEENGAGASAILNDRKFTPIKPDQIFSLHNVPGFNKGTIVCKEGTFTASVSSIVIKLKGKTAHAAEPENGINPDLAISELISSIKNKSVPEKKKDNFNVITTVYANLGSKDYGISAGEGEVHFTVRTWEAEKLEVLKKEIETTIEKISAKHQLDHNIEWVYEFAANENKKEAVDLIKKAAIENKLEFQQKKYPFKWGEDFGIFTQVFNGAMFGLGAGKNTPALHNPDYDFPDELLPMGIGMFYSILKSIHG